MAELLADSFLKILIPGLIYTIPLTILSFGIGMVIAVVVALLRCLPVRILDKVAWVYVWVFRGTPLLVQIFIIFYGLPAVGIVFDPFPAAVLAFSLNVGAYGSEILRGAILSVPRGQMEAGISLGMGRIQVMRYVIVPQAFRMAVPALFNSFIGLVKDTSLAANITVSEMFMAAQRIAAVTYEPLAVYLEVAFLYLLFCTVLSGLQGLVEKRFEFAGTLT